MNNIYIVGDTHGTWTNILKVINKYDIHNDVVIVAGDFGFIWNGDTKDLFKLQKRFSERNCVLTFVDGNHENFERLYKYPEVKWCGGSTHKISENIFHLMRGQVFTIFGKTFFTMGGAHSIDKLQRINRISWWEEEDITYTDVNTGIDNLALVDNKVDYVITHTCPEFIKSEFIYWGKDKMEHNANEKILSEFSKMLTFSHWYFGHYHLDKTLYDYTCLYNEVVEIKGTEI